MAIYCAPQNRPRMVTLLDRRFWWVVRLCRFLVKISQGQFDETWEKRKELDNGTIEYEFHIRLILNDTKNV